MVVKNVGILFERILMKYWFLLWVEMMFSSLSKHDKPRVVWTQLSVTSIKMLLKEVFYLFYYYFVVGAHSDPMKQQEVFHVQAYRVSLLTRAWAEFEARGPVRMWACVTFVNLH